jgi:hypothetical protein
MRSHTRIRRIGTATLAAASLSSLGLVGAANAAPSVVVAKSAAASAITRTFSFIGPPNSKTTTIVNLDFLTINARCDSHGFPVIFAFSGFNNAEIFGRVIDAHGRIHVINNSAFTKANKGIQLSLSTNADFDSTGTVLYQTSSGRVVVVQFAFDNSTTLNRMNVCAVYGSAVAT